MNLNDYASAWKRQESPAKRHADHSTLPQTLEAKSRKLARTLFWRDIREASAGIFIAAVFALKGWHMGPAGWPVAFAVTLMLGLSAFFVRERIRTRRNRLGVNAPMLAKLESDITELIRQRWLLLNVATWYLAPCVSAIVLVRISTMKDPFSHASYWMFLALLFWSVWALNRRAVRTQIEPRLAELEKLRSNLLSPN